MSQAVNIERLVANLAAGTSDTTAGLANALRCVVAGSGESIAFVSFYNATGATLYGVLAAGLTSVPANTTPTLDAVTLLAGERKTLTYPCRTEIWDAGTWAVLSSTSGTVTIAGASAGLILRVNYPLIP